DRLDKLSSAPCFHEPTRAATEAQRRQVRERDVVALFYEGTLRPAYDSDVMTDSPRLPAWPRAGERRASHGWSSRRDGRCRATASATAAAACRRKRSPRAAPRERTPPAARRPRSRARP